MTPHRLTVNEKVTELDNPIAAAAILKGPGLVGVLLTGPSRLALANLAGGAPHVIQLHLEGAQEVALLSADTALVRTADGAVWALANLAGEARPKAIARDIRSLHARPGGASAIGIGVDGSATAFSVARGEISARTITARGGALRTADLDEHVTYVIAEGEEGGVFRIHPGATPELGTSARAVLPRGALELDRLRGGTSLAIAFKRGEATIAAVTGGPRRFDAKLLQLGGKVADAAVIGASLAVVFLDGRAALYDEDTLARAGAEPTQPTSAITLSTRGRPRVLLATTNKGAPSLWLGTTSGELLSIAVEMAESKAKEEEAAAAIEAPKEEPEAKAEEAAVVEAEPEAAPDLTVRLAEIDAELAIVRAAFKNVEAAREQERSEAAEQMRSALAEAEERATRELATTVRAEREESELTLANHGRELEASSALALRTLREEHAAAFARVEQSHDQALASRDEALAALKQRFEEEQQALSNELDTTAKRLGAEIDRAIAAETELAARTQHLASEHAEVDGLRAELDRLREETAQQKAEVEDQKSAIEELEASLRRERDRAITAEHAAESVINVDRAREKLGGVIARVKSEIQKRR